MLANSASEKYRSRALAFFSFANSLLWAVMPYLGGVLVDLKGALIAVRRMLLTSALLGTAAGNVASLIFKFLVVGSILDRFQRRRVLLVVLAFDSFNYLLFIFCRSFPILSFCESMPP